MTDLQKTLLRSLIDPSAVKVCYDTLQQRCATLEELARVLHEHSPYAQEQLEVLDPANAMHRKRVGLDTDDLASFG